MQTFDRELWDRVSAFAIDEGVEDLTFAARLAAENDWTTEFAERAIEEYRRFVYLAMRAGHAVTPSDQVDQVWHLHLTYTRSYWECLCGQVLGRPLHHGPTKGGGSEDAKYRAWYERTLQSYRDAFGAEPPADVWPAADIRFGEDLHFKRVNTWRHWVVAKPVVSRTTIAAGMLAMLGAAIAVSWLVSPSETSPRIDAPLRASLGATCFFAMIAIVIAAIVLNAALDGRCSQCKSIFSRKRTGAKRPGQKRGRVQEEWKCKNCGAISWRTMPPAGSSASSGCSGIGGCSSGCGGGCGGGD